MTFAKIFTFEIGSQLRRRSTWLYFVLALAISLQASMSSLLAGARKGGYFFNSPFAIAAVSVFACIFGLLITAGIAGNAATRDIQTRMEPLVYTTQVRKTTLLGARFLAAFMVSALLLSAVPLAILLATNLPGIEPELIGPFSATAHLRAYLIFLLPSTFAASAIFFCLAALGRHALASFVGAALLFVLMMFSSEYIAERRGQWELAKKVDPLAFTVMREASRTTTPEQKNLFVLDFDGSVLANRLIWIAIGLGALGLTFARFRFIHHAAQRRPFRWIGRGAIADIDREGAMVARSAPVAVPADRRRFGRETRVRQAIVIALHSFRDVVSSWPALLLAAAMAVMLWFGPEMMEHLGVPLVPVTDYVIDRLAATEDITGFLGIFLIVFFAGELVWRDRDVFAGEVIDTAPVPDSILLTGKLLGLSLVIVAMQALMMAGGIATQIRLGHFELEPATYLKLLFGLQLIDYLLFVVLAVAVHVIVNQKYIGHFVLILVFGQMMLASEFGIDQRVFVYGGAPGWEYSDMRGFGGNLGAVLWFKLYWAGWALLLALAARLLWVRGTEDSLRARMRLARQRRTSAAGLGIATALALIFATGGFIFYNTHILNASTTDDQRAARRAEYERRYGQYRNLPQPELTATRLHIEITPERSEAVIRGVYTLENRHGVPIGEIHTELSPSAELTSLTFDRASTMKLSDDDFNYRVHALSEPLQPGESVALRFEARIGARGFTNDGVESAVVANGTHFENDILPAIGYGEHRELTSPADRRTHDLPPKPEVRPLEDASARYDTKTRERISFEAVIGTSPGQTAVAPGRLLRTWNQTGRSYFHYRTDAPIRNGYAILSARYETFRTKWNDVEIEILHHPDHAWHVERMASGVAASLGHFSAVLGPYPHGQIRLVEAPGLGIGLRAHPINIRYNEGFSLLDAEADERGFDFPFGVIAHEVAHQWWGNQVSPAQVEGAAVLSESLAWYSAIGAVEKVHGREHLEKLLGLMREAYLTPRSEAGVPLLKVGNWFGAYRKGPFVMHALREYIGEENVDRALRRMIERFGSGTPPFPTTLDLYAELQAVTPPHLMPLLHDLFEANTWWRLRTADVTAVPAVGGTWNVTMKLSARKVVVDPAGVESERPMNDLVEIGVFEAGESPLYLKMHRIRSGEQTVTVNVPRQPSRAGIDPRALLIDTDGSDNVREIAKE